MITTAHFKATKLELAALLDSVDIGIDPAHIYKESDTIWRIWMKGENSVEEWPAPDKFSSRIDFALGNLVRSAVTGTEPNGDPIVTSMARGHHITMRVVGPHGTQFIGRLREAYSHADAVIEDHDSPPQLLTFFGVENRLVATRFGCTLIAMTPPEDYEPGTGPQVLQDVYSGLKYPAHRFA